MLKYEDYLLPKVNVRNYSTVYEMLKTSCEEYKDKTVFQRKTKNGDYKKITYGEFWEISDKLAKFLKSRGANSSKKIGIMAENRPEWGISYLSIMKTGATIIPVDAQMGLEDLQFVLTHSGTEILFISKNKFKNVLSKHIKKCKKLKLIILMDETKIKNPKIFSWNGAIKKGEKVKTKPKVNIKPEKILELLYTSGTTGNPKAVMLTHKNIISDIKGVVRMEYLSSDDVFLSLLPIHHVFESTAGFILPLYLGATITYAESFKSNHIIANIKETNVTVVLGVPLLFEKIYFGILRGVSEKSHFVRFMFQTMLYLTKFSRYFVPKGIGGVLFKGLRKKAGLDSLRLLISGGGPLPYIVAKGYIELGFTLIQGYGLSETSPVVTVGTEKYNNPKSIGLPLPDVKIKIDNPDKKGIGEIILKGPMVMKGYYKNPSATKEVKKRGWFYTGDAGFIDKKGYIYITGRLKNVIVTHGGKNVFPEELEEKLNLHPYIKESMVYGKALSDKVKGERVEAIIVPDYDFLSEEWKTVKNAGISDEDVKKEISDIVATINDKLPAYKKISYWIINKHELIKTSTKKVKRYLYKTIEKI